MEPTEQNLSGRVMDQPKEVPQGTISIARSKRTAQHADHHDCEIKTRKAADKAARVQQRAGELVQQLSQEDDGASHKARGLLATAEKRQNADSKLVHPQLWPDDDQQVSQPSRLQKDPLTKVHYHEPHAPRPKSTSPPNRSHKKRRSPVKQTNSDSSVEPGITPVDSDRPDAEATSGNSQDRTRTQSPPGACSEFGSTQKLKHSLKSNPNMTAILDRQIREQTNQNHPQDYPDDGQRYFRAVSCI